MDDFLNIVVGNTTLREHIRSWFETNTPDWCDMSNNTRVRFVLRAAENLYLQCKDGVVPQTYIPANWSTILPYIAPTDLTQLLPIASSTLEG